MKKVNWVSNSPDVVIKPPTKGTGHKMPDTEEDGQPEVPAGGGDND